jgi:hypothetical protein
VSTLYEVGERVLNLDLGSAILTCLALVGFFLVLAAYSHFLGRMQFLHLISQWSRFILLVTFYLIHIISPSEKIFTEAINISFSRQLVQCQQYVGIVEMNVLTNSS